MFTPGTRGGRGVRGRDPRPRARLRPDWSVTVHPERSDAASAAERSRRTTSTPTATSTRGARAVEPARPTRYTRAMSDSCCGAPVAALVILLAAVLGALFAWWATREPERAGAAVAGTATPRSPGRPGRRRGPPPVAPAHPRPLCARDCQRRGRTGHLRGPCRLDRQRPRGRRCGFHLLARGSGGVGARRSRRCVPLRAAGGGPVGPSAAVVAPGFLPFAPEWGTARCSSTRAPGGRCADRDRPRSRHDCRPRGRSRRQRDRRRGGAAVRRRGRGRARADRRSLHDGRGGRIALRRRRGPRSRRARTGSCPGAPRWTGSRSCGASLITLGPARMACSGPRAHRGPRRREGRRSSRRRARHRPPRCLFGGTRLRHRRSPTRRAASRSRKPPAPDTASPRGRRGAHPRWPGGLARAPWSSATAVGCAAACAMPRPG